MQIICKQFQLIGYSFIYLNLIFKFSRFTHLDIYIVLVHLFKLLRRIPWCISSQGYHKTLHLKLGSLNIPHSFSLEVQSPSVGVAGSFWRLCGRICSTPLSSFWLLPAIFGVPQPVNMSFQSLPPSSHGTLLSMS